LAQVNAMTAEDRAAQISPVWLARVNGPNPDFWTLGFSIVESATGASVGTCGYTAPPGKDETVEIAYMIVPEHRGKGYATEAAAGMTQFAFASGQVGLVCAHTLPEASASTRVLTKCGFQKIGEINHAEDGLIWRWEKQES
jgi:RimJ/RimL family protein N-acetyltransferase